MTAFEKDVGKAYTECGVSPAPKFSWGDREKKTACPLMAAYIAVNGDYPVRGVLVGHWAMKHYSMSREFAEGILNGYDHAQSDVVASDEFRAGFKLGHKLAETYLAKV